MDSTYYQNNLSFLFESSDNNKPPVYDTDTLLYTYTNKDTFVNNLVPGTYFNDISGIQLKQESVTDVNNRAGETDAATKAALNTSYAFTDNASQNELRADVTRGSTMSSVIIQLINDEISHITAKETLQNSIVSQQHDITKSHNAFNNYMRGVLSAVCAKQFKDALVKLSPVPNVTANNVKDAAEVLDTGSNNRMKDMIFYVVSDTANKSLVDLIHTLTNIRTDVIANFSNTSNGFTRPLYYQLRSDIISKLYLPSNVLPDQNDHVLLYIKRILADTYIKTCYPLIHYDFINAMMQKYADAGDFINVRIALLAKVFFVYYFVDYINVNIFQTDSTLSTDVKNNYSNIINSVNTNLNNYMVSLNNINMNGDPGRNELAEIMNSLQKLSVDVVNQSQDMSSLKEQIEENQLALRNIISNTEIIQREYHYKIAEFIIAVIFVVIFVVVSCILLFLNKPDYVLYLAGGIFIVIVLIKIIQFIIKFLR